MVTSKIELRLFLVASRMDGAAYRGGNADKGILG